MGLLAKASVAIDGSKFKAVNSRDNNFTKGKMERRLAQIEESVARYLSQLDTADRQTAAGEAPWTELPARTTRLKEKLIKLEEEVKRLKAIEKVMLAAPDQQVSFTDPDSRSMATSGRGSGMVGYNVQAAVDTTNHLIVAHEVTNVGTDKSHLANMANQAKAALEAENLEAFADRGYFKGEEILACDEAGITVTLPKPQTSEAKSEGRFGKQDFRYVAEEDIYICPTGEKLTNHFTNEENGLVLHHYWTNACRTCALKAQCTKGPQRRIKRWEHEHVVDAVQARLDKNPDAMRTRRETVEHPSGTLKMRMGATHFLMKTLPKVATEVAVHVLADNLTRMMNILGIKPLPRAIPQPMICDEAGDRCLRRVSMQQRAMRQVHPAQGEKTDRAHAQMLLTGSAERSLRDADGCADFRQIQRPVGICGQVLLESRDDRVVAASTRCGSQANAIICKTSDHDMDQLVFERAKHLRQLQDFGSVAGKLPNRPV